MPSKISWQGIITSVQPRIRLTRSFDQRSHSYLGYVLRIDGQVDEQDAEFRIAIGKAAYQKHSFRVGDIIGGQSQPVLDPRTEMADYYKTSGLKVLTRSVVEDSDSPPSPPWLGVAPDLEVYRERGHRRLAARTYETKCSACLWGSQMPVEMIIDQWNPEKKRYRTETFCYGPKSCSLYRPGPTRKVPGRKGMNWEEEDWIDEEAVAHRSLDE
jgi:hypothetical protein